MLVLNFLRLRGGAPPGDRNDVLDPLRRQEVTDFSAYETSPADDHNFAARSQRWWYAQRCRADADGELAARGHLQC